MNKCTPAFVRNDVIIKNQDVVYRGFHNMTAYTLQIPKFLGGSMIVNREILHRPEAVVVIPYDPNLDQVVLIEQFRAACVEQDQSPWMFEFVAGLMDKKDETIETVGRRELMEEAGLEAKAMHSIASYWVNPGCTDEKVHVLCAHVSAQNASGVFGCPDEQEDTRVLSMPVDDAFQALQQGAMNHSSAWIGMLWLYHNRANLQKQWLK